MADLSKGDIIDAVAAATGVEKSKVQAVLSGLESEITKALQKGSSVALTGFVTFKTAKVAAKSGVTKLGGVEKAWSKPAHTTVKVKPGKKLKDAV